uniref:Uncharacterized protein n=1 Tax=Arion vulgaris TaxID=1028688 RepID=A0A0B7ARJ5_9EUPU
MSLTSCDCYEQKEHRCVTFKLYDFASDQSEHLKAWISHDKKQQQQYSIVKLSDTNPGWKQQETML